MQRNREKFRDSDEGDRVVTASCAAVSLPPPMRRATHRRTLIKLNARRAPVINEVSRKSNYRADRRPGSAPSNETKLHRDALRVLPALEITLTPASAGLHGVRVNSVIELADNCRVSVTRNSSKPRIEESRGKGATRGGAFRRQEGIQSGTLPPCPSRPIAISPFTLDNHRVIAPRCKSTLPGASSRASALFIFVGLASAPLGHTISRLHWSSSRAPGPLARAMHPYRSTCVMGRVYASLIPRWQRTCTGMAIRSSNRRHIETSDSDRGLPVIPSSCFSLLLSSSPFNPNTERRGERKFRRPGWRTRLLRHDDAILLAPSPRSSPLDPLPRHPPQRRPSYGSLL
jgi:hypothetical protein